MLRGSVIANYLTVAEVAERLRVSPKTIRREIREGRLPAIDWGEGTRPYWRILESDIDILIGQRYPEIERRHSA